MVDRREQYQSQDRIFRSLLKLELEVTRLNVNHPSRGSLNIILSFGEDSISILLILKRQSGSAKICFTCLFAHIYGLLYFIKNLPEYKEHILLIFVSSHGP